MREKKTKLFAAIKRNKTGELTRRCFYFHINMFRISSQNRRLIAGFSFYHRHCIILYNLCDKFSLLHKISAEYYYSGRALERACAAHSFRPKLIILKKYRALQRTVTTSTRTKPCLVLRDYIIKNYIEKSQLNDRIACTNVSKRLHTLCFRAIFHFNCNFHQNYHSFSETFHFFPSKKMVLIEITVEICFDR